MASGLSSYVSRFDSYARVTLWKFFTYSIAENWLARDVFLRRRWCHWIDIRTDRQLFHSFYRDFYPLFDDVPWATFDDGQLWVHVQETTALKTKNLLKCALDHRRHLLGSSSVVRGANLIFLFNTLKRIIFETSKPSGVRHLITTIVCFLEALVVVVVVVISKFSRF